MRTTRQISDDSYYVFESFGGPQEELERLADLMMKDGREQAVEPSMTVMRIGPHKILKGQSFSGLNYANKMMNFVEEAVEQPPQEGLSIKAWVEGRAFARSDRNKFIAESNYRITEEEAKREQANLGFPYQGYGFESFTCYKMKEDLYVSRWQCWTSAD